MIVEAVSKVKYGLETTSLAQRGVGWLASLVGLNGAIQRGKSATIRPSANGSSPTISTSIISF